MARRPTIVALVAACMLVAAPVALAGSTYATTVLSNPSLVSLWRFNEQGAQTDAEGMAVADATGANPGVYHLGVNPGEPGPLEGDSGTATHFGAPDGYAQVPYSPSLNTSTFTIEGWVNFDALADYMVVAGNGAQLSNKAGYTINTFDDFGKPSLDLWVGNGTTSQMLRGLDYTPGQWVYFAGTYDGTTARWYENGQLVASRATTYVPNTSLPDVVGLNPVNSSSGQLLGSTADMAVYNSALSAPTIAQHYQLGISDGIPPQTTLQSAPSGVTDQTTATFQFASTAVGSTYQCQLDGGAWQICSSPYQVAGLASGQHRLVVRALNRAGQVDPTPPSAVWTVDTLAPLTSFTSGPLSSTASTGATFSFTSAPGSAYTCQLDAAPPTPCSSPYPVSGLLDGEHTLVVQATAPAGSVKAITYSWSVDTAAPTTFITQGPTTGRPLAAFTFLANQSSVSFRCQVDSGPWTACSSPFAAFPLTSGTHTFRVKATDALGIVDPSDHAYTWTVTGKVSPQLSVSFPRQIGSAGARARTLSSRKRRCGANTKCVAQASAASQPRFSCRVTGATTLSLTVLDKHGRRVAQTSFSLRGLAGSIGLPTSLLRKLTPGRYSAVLQARAGSLTSSVVRAPFSVVR